MQIATRPEVQEVATEFARLARKIAREEPVLDDQAVSTSVTEVVGAELSASGWRDVCEVPNGEGGLPMLAAVVEAGVRGPFPIPYPILEDWGSHRALQVLLSDIMGDDFDTDSLPGFPVVVIDLAEPAVLQSNRRPTTLLVPARASQLLALELVQGEFLMHVGSKPNEVDRPAPLDPTLPTVSVLTQGVAADAFRRIAVPLEVAERIVAEQLCLQNAELLGAASWMFETTLSHLKTRKQFDRTLSSFQALQHRMAELLVQLETARSLHLAAVDRVEADGPNALDHAIATKGYVGQIATHTGNEAIQLHGGMGFTWEAGLQWPLRRIYYRASAPFSSRCCLAGAGRRAIRRGSAIESVPLAEWAEATPQG